MQFQRFVSELKTLPCAILVIVGMHCWFLGLSLASVSSLDCLYLCIDTVILFGVERLLFYGLRIGYEKPVHWCISFLLALLPSLGLILLYRWTRILLALLF